MFLIFNDQVQLSVCLYDSLSSATIECLKPFYKLRANIYQKFAATVLPVKNQQEFASSELFVTAFATDILGRNFSTESSFDKSCIRWNLLECFKKK